MRNSLIDWVARITGNFGRVRGVRDRRIWAIESAAGLGRLLAQQLIAYGERVVDVPRDGSGAVAWLIEASKNDPNDA